MNNGHTTPVLVALLLFIAAAWEGAAGHWSNVAWIIIGGIAIGLCARWLYFRLSK